MAQGSGAMKPVWVAACLLALGVLGVAQAQSPPGGAAAPPQPAVDRGVAAVATRCALCHGEQMVGGDHAPALKGPEFWSQWEGRPARELYSRIISTMPLDEPGSLSEQETIGIVDFIVRSNTGSAAVGSVPDASGLSAITLPPARP